MNHSRVALIIAIAACLISPAHAAITWTGDIDPDDPTALWYGGGRGTTGYVGKTAAGTLAVTEDSDLGTRYGYVGYEPGASGEVTIDGAGSTWTGGELSIGYGGDGLFAVTSGGALITGNSFIGYEPGSTGVVSVDGVDSMWNCSADLEVGRGGNGTLKITDGGAVNVTRHTFVASESGSTGEIHFDGGTLSTGSLLCDVEDLTGRGTINTHGLVSDVDLVFDATHGASQTLILDEFPGQDIALNLDLEVGGRLGVGYAGTAEMRITGGVSVKSGYSYLGYKSGSSGTVTVDEQSYWTNNNLFIGRQGCGALEITGILSRVDSLFTGYIGVDPGSTGQVIVDEHGSWSSGYLHVGSEGNGTLTIRDAGSVSGHETHIGYSADSTGQVTVDGEWSSLWASDLYVGNAGTGTVSITGGARAYARGDSYIGYLAGSRGQATVEGSGSTWTTQGFFGLNVGGSGVGTLAIQSGGTVISEDDAFIGRESGSSGHVSVDGIGSMWSVAEGFYIGLHGSGTLTVSHGGLVTVARTYNFYIDYDSNGNSFINMATGGMLALASNETGDDSLQDFLDLIDGTDAINYWDDTLADWAPITDATPGVDYTIEYQTTGNLAGYTLLTVGTIPEPASGFIAIAGLALAVGASRGSFIHPSP